MKLSEYADLTFSREVLVAERDRAVTDPYRDRCVRAIATIDALRAGVVDPLSLPSDEAPEAL